MQWKLLKGEAVEADASTTSQAFRLIEKTAKPKKPDKSNSIYQSKTDPQARLAQKAGKPFRLYYLSSMAVDTFHHVITHIQADYADERDSVHLLPMVEKVAIRLKQHGLLLKDILADRGFGSGINGPATSVHRVRAAIAYNIQKLLRGLTHPKVKSQIMVLQQDIFYSLSLCHNHLPYFIPFALMLFTPLVGHRAYTLFLYPLSMYPILRHNEKVVL